MKTTRFGMSLDDELLKHFDALIDKKGYANRSEAIRDLIRDLITQEEWKVSDKEMVGTVTLVFNHEAHELSDKLTDLQHNFFKNIVSSTHIHLDHHNCLEVLILKGKSKDIKTISDKLISTKGVKHGKLVMTSSGKNI
ncbi:MAG: nickel-responsive transcriptional regulator NikR [Candidatus Margulisbacteria bacterium]|nr:nickel-responsive transcriptional regulator NikR [Candidatus Margulisiibacteriota bacterium]MBU1021686.1 nickel-responsive transcriptional regulator NikR [Candidatus Margulisiibacteriota bacterium]MBU1729564.1 nickel-responsive transcriptional regulator NikR [Candidatus Margulisiibacteriota bacterium]MBU1955050.1 nickel-responsive transcriptional regulator NikR [Candidatus Margulisiibacteriota bacterium]